MTTLMKILVTTALIQYLASTLVIGRPRLAEKSPNKNDANGGLRDYFFELRTHRHKRNVQIMSRDGSKAILGKEMKHHHLQRIKRDVKSHPCYKHGSFKRIRLDDNSAAFSVECLKSTTTGCFHNVPIYTTTLCTENFTYFPRTGQSIVQSCSCA